MEVSAVLIVVTGQYQIRAPVTVSTVFSHAFRYFIRFVILSVISLRGRLFRFFVFLFPCPVQGEVLEHEQAMESCHVLGHGVACVGVMSCVRPWCCLCRLVASVA